MPVSYEQNEMLNLNCACEVQGVKVSGSVDKQADRTSIRGHIRRGHVNAVYPYLIHEAATQLPRMTTLLPVGQFGRKIMTFKNRSFHPNQHFLFSEQRLGTGGAAGADRLRNEGPFRFVRRAFRPDEIIDPTQEITFIAIGQHHTSEQLVNQMISTEGHDPVKAITLALVPRGDEEGTYRRVGLAVWRDRAWYGYLCGWKDHDTEGVKELQEWAPERHVGDHD